MNNEAFNAHKFQLGQIVTTAMHAGYGAGDKLLIVGRILTESVSGIRREYVCSQYKLGDMVRQIHYEEELAELERSDA